jgi:hypothetical protein
MFEWRRLGYLNALMQNRFRNNAIALAALAALATGSLGLTAAGAKPHKATHVGTKVKIAYSAPAGEYSPDTGFTGKVKAKKGCASKRTVKLSKYGKTKTSKTGTFAFGVSGDGAAPGKYKVKVLESKISKGGEDFICDPVQAKLTVK